MNIIEKFKAVEFVVHCKTQEEATSFVNICDENDIRWATTPVTETHWKVYKEETCYSATPYNHFLSYCNKKYFKNTYVKVITFKKFMKKYTEFKKWESKNITTKEEIEMCSNGKLNKGIENLCVQDMYRAVTLPNGSITFNKAKLSNLCFVKFDGNDKTYVFNNKSDKRLKEGTRVIVDTVRGEMQATVVRSVKILDKYVNDLIYAFCGKDAGLKDVVGIVTKTTQIVETVQRICEDGTKETD